MHRALSEILTETIQTAEIQLTAARTLDVETLRSATSRRQDLLFELDLVEEADLDAADTSVLRELMHQLANLDRRLTTVLQSTSRVLRRIITPGGSTTYAADGRLRGEYA